jgi:hypothetical protein
MCLSSVLWPNLAIVKNSVLWYSKKKRLGGVMISTMQKQHKNEKAKRLVTKHQLEIIEELGPRALDLLTPGEAAGVLDIETMRIPDLIREGWLAAAPGKDIGSAHQYYRWRVELVKRYRRRYEKHK